MKKCTNKYITLGQAKKAWNSNAWSWERRYFTSPGSAAICREKDSDSLFIVVHSQNVEEKRLKGEIIENLN